MHRNLRILYVLIALTAALGLVMQMQQPAGLLGNVDGTDFAVEDTSLVDRIFIADMDGNQVLLERPEKGRLWDVNGQFKAREDAIDLLLKTFKRTTVQGPVAQAAQPNVIRLLAARGKKVEVYQGGDQPVKTWYVGTATPSHTGTYMLLETPAGKADEPFVVHMEGFTGFLSTRFFTNLEEWRYTGMFDFPARTLQSVKFTHAETPSEGYTLTKGEDGQLELATPQGESLTYLDTSGVRGHFLRFKKVHLETYNSRLDEAMQDSLRTAAPDFVLEAEGAGGKRSTIRVHWKPRQGLDRDAEGGLMAYDGEQLYGVTDAGEVVLLQRFVFDPLLRGASDLMLPRLVPVSSFGLQTEANLDASSLL